MSDRPEYPKFAFPLSEKEKRLGEIVTDNVVAQDNFGRDVWGGVPPRKAEDRPLPEEENRALPVVWADKAMFTAEPIDATAGPQVYLLWMTPDPLGAIAAACKMYKGEVVRSLSDVTDSERIEFFEQIQRTKLKAPFEFVKFHFMIEGVSRAFTHQMVRQRTAVYAQESLRFAVKEDMPQYMPPSVAADPNAYNIWEEHNADTQTAYDKLIALGIPAEDARGRLPHDTLTRLHYSTDLRALLDHAGNRLCTQAQFEWRLVFSRMIEAIRKAENAESGPLDVVGSPGYVKMSRELTELFQPACYQTGRCEFKANFDRSCSIRDRVDANEAAGRKPAEWGESMLGGMGKVLIPEIKVGEWLLDAKAARKS